LGRADEARSAMGRLRKLSPHITGGVLRQVLPFRDAKMLEIIVSGLVAAGLPE
jgi:hypothetical protein